ncbi:MAG: hypothetical protein K5744_09165 [Eubacterium sp.]|nr:hypothetical protein [Eubacterium sp.]
MLTISWIILATVYMLAMQMIKKTDRMRGLVLRESEYSLSGTLMRCIGKKSGK